MKIKFLRAALILVAATVACSPQTNSLPGILTVTVTATPPTMAYTKPPPGTFANPTPDLSNLLLIPPFPYNAPLPPQVPTAIDGAYVKFDPQTATPTPCRRCADYRLEGGVWTLDFDKGVFRIHHLITDWQNSASYTVSGNQLKLFNDPTCVDTIGTYTWLMEGRKLTLQAIDDTCAIKVRAENLTAMPWDSCEPPTREAALTDHWPKPAGC